MHLGNGWVATVRYFSNLAFRQCCIAKLGAILSSLMVYEVSYLFIIIFKIKKIFLSWLSRQRFGDYCWFCSFNFELYFFFSGGVTSLVIYFSFSNSKKYFCLGLGAEGLVIIVCFVP